MTIQGSLSTMTVSDLLQFLAAGKKTGLLKCSHAKVVKGIYFENGSIVGSSTNDPGEYLGQVLIHYGKITESQLQAAMEIQRGGDQVQTRISDVQSPGGKEVSSPKSQASSPAGKEVSGSKSQASSPGGKEVASNKSQASSHTPARLGQILVAQGLLTDAEVSKVLRIRTLDIIYDLFIWKEGHFEFYFEGPLPADFTRVNVEVNRVIMEGAYRADEFTRYRTLIPSDRTVMELGTGWTSSLGSGKETRELLYFLEKRMSVAEICYNMHSSSFEVYGQLYDLVQKGVARVAGELPETPDPVVEIADLPEAAADLLLLARRELDNDGAEKAISIIHTLLRHEPQNTAAHNLLLEAEKKFIEQVYAQIPQSGVPKIVVPLDDLASKGIGPQEGFVLSRINGEWDIQSILSICPFREADSLLMIKKLWDQGIVGF
ncbi:MAG: DUF4388 domain-containing protein [Acidobacteriota bacterium]|nr:DUF4388 domain-containing protein [Acidobacteriota bacterium]